ncbi:cytochrome d ubiquinol oxidase subunit II [Halioxenophilus sp. WMMB6]|uniref:cytochrome d ubiquinol oxidase subunit II n=1 Tax=Halioxenophilus sp. WMMB6 TaxID=3073815 RepID=UPI00295EEB8A|nr:cytochrome d ubiquinol oxidase subunit II [Halioxenophilus sp. WMMB6]
MDYELLKLIWWLLIGVLLIGFAIADGFDFGVLSLLRWVGRTDNERRVVLNTVGPHWDGNQVWFITAGGAIFAAWPVVYAVAFSGLYWALLLVLFALFFRPVGFEYRSKIESARWRNNWDWVLTTASLVPSLVFGVAFGNLLLGVPFHFDEQLLPFYEGTFWQLLTPFALLCGLVSVTLLMSHGGIYLQLRTEGAMQARARTAVMWLSLLCAVLFVLAGIWVAFLPGLSITAIPPHHLASTPLDKTVAIGNGGWLANYRLFPLLQAVPVVAVVMLLATWLLARVNRPGVGFVTSSLAIAAVIFTAAGSLFPFVLPSSSNINHSLTLWDVTSSEKTLTIMFGVAVIFVPIVLSYTAWGYWKMRGRVTQQHIEENPYSTY